MQVNGLYGHVRRNDTRSVALFAGFVVCFHLLALLMLFIPLAMLDPAHSPIYGWAGYFRQWVPLLTLAAALLFLIQFAWHVRFVRIQTRFRFVDNTDEPRLCQIIEPLTIAAGIPTPYVAVIDSPALNAFACGIRKKDAVLVFTRGLIDGLDDDELAAVAAHEITHIVNGDIRLIAATNVCIQTLMLLQRRNTKRTNRIWEGLTLPLFGAGMPLMFVLILIIYFLRQQTIYASNLTRLLIASSREFIADAEAVRLTQNPAALVSALGQIEGRSRIAELGAGEDAMMIDGAQDGATATHPTIAERIAAIVAVTGSMALIAPARRDTRPAFLRAGSGFGRRGGSAITAKRPSARAFKRASAGNGCNHLGLTPEMSIGAVAAIAAFFVFHGAEMRNPSSALATLDPRSLRTFFDMAAKGVACEGGGTPWFAGHGNRPKDCGSGGINDGFAAHRGENNLVGWLGAREGSGGLYAWPDGTERSYPPPAVAAEQVRRERCFQTEPYQVGDRGLHSVFERSSGPDSISLNRYLDLVDHAALSVNSASSEQRDAALKAYFQTRKTMFEVIHRFFGAPGLLAANAAFAGQGHQNAVALLGERLKDPRFTAEFDPVGKVEAELLAQQPQEFMSCVARHGQPAGPGGSSD